MMSVVLPFKNADWYYMQAGTTELQEAIVECIESLVIGVADVDVVESIVELMKIDLDDEAEATAAASEVLDMCISVVSNPIAQREVNCLREILEKNQDPTVTAMTVGPNHLEVYINGHGSYPAAPEVRSGPFPFIAAQ